MSAEARGRKGGRGRKRTYNTRLIKREFPYFIAEIADLFQLHANAVRRWIKAGLRTVDGRRPLLVHGSDLIDFLDSKQEKRKQRCAINEFYCCRCRLPRKPRLNRIKIQIRNEATLNLSGVCEACGARMNRAGSVARIVDYARAFDVQTTPGGRISGCSDPNVMCHLPEDSLHAALQSEK
jgi:hypothetical protein